MPYDDIDIGQHWTMQWLVVWRQQVITWTNIDYSSVTFSGIYLRSFLQRMPKLLSCIMRFEIAFSMLLPYISGTNELMKHCDYFIQYIPRNMHTVFALLCFVVVIHWLIFPYPSGLLHWHCGNLTIAPVPAKQPWWIWINTSCEFIMNDCITTTKQCTTKPCAYFLGYTVFVLHVTEIASFSEDDVLFSLKNNILITESCYWHKNWQLP